MKEMPDQNQNAYSFDYKIFVYKRLKLKGWLLVDIATF